MIHVEMLRWRGDDDRIVNAMATAGGPLGDTLHAPVYADLGPQVLVVLFKMSALSVRGGCPLGSFPIFNYGPGSRKLPFHLRFAILSRRRDTHGVICDGGYGHVDMMDMDVM